MRWLACDARSVLALCINRLLIAAFLVGAAAARAGPPSPPAVLLADTVIPIDAQTLGNAWVDGPGNAGLVKC